MWSARGSGSRAQDYEGARNTISGHGSSVHNGRAAILSQRGSEGEKGGEKEAGSIVRAETVYSTKYNVWATIILDEEDAQVGNVLWAATPEEKLMNEMMAEKIIEENQ